MSCCHFRTLPTVHPTSPCRRSPRVIRPSAVSLTGSVAGGRYVTYINRSIGPDERVESGGTVVVRGNVDHDAYIQAVGDVMVWGRLSGHVHAGCQGDTNASISALELRGAHLVIAQVKSLAAARITVPGPHTARVTQAGLKRVLQLMPLGAPHPPASTAGVAKSFTKWLQWYPAAGAALLTGAYAFIAGIALLLAPHTVLGLLFNTKGLEPGWIRLGGVLFATFGMQYLGTALIDWRLAHSSSDSNSNEGLPDMPFMPASPRQNSNSSGHNSSELATQAQPQQMPSVSARQSRAEAAEGSQQQLQQQHMRNQPSLGIYDHPPSLTPNDAGSSSTASNTDYNHHAELQYASWLCSSTGFYEASVWSRLVLAVLFCGLVVAGHCQPGLLLLAGLNFFGALGMMNALKQQWCMHVMGDLPAEAECS